MKINIKKYLKETLKFVVLLAIILNVVSYYRSMDLNKDKLEETSFKLLDNSIYNIPKDKAVLIHFWATWCPVCKVEAPNIQAVSKDYEVITIASQSGSKKQIEKYLKENNLNFKVVNDEDGNLARKFKISVFPTTFIYNKDKNLEFTEVGYTSTFGLLARMWWSK